MRRVMRRIISQVLLMCGRGVRIILKLPLVARCRDNICVYMEHVCFMPVVVTVWRSVRKFVV